MANIINSLNTRTEPLTPQEYEQAIGEIAALPTSAARDYYIRMLGDRNLLPTSTSADGLRQSVQRFSAARASIDGLFIGQDAQGRSIEPDQLHYQVIRVNPTVGQPLSFLIHKDFEQVVNTILLHPDLRTPRYLQEATTVAQTLLAVGTFVVDHYGPGDVRDKTIDPILNSILRPQGVTPLTREEMVLLAWELLARIDFALDGETDEAELRRALGGQRKLDQYKALKGFIETSGLKPMSQRALAIRDGREKPFAVFAGQGSNYLAELKELIETEPSARALYNELKPLFNNQLPGFKTLDDLLKMADLTPEEQLEIENYYAVNQVAVSIPVIGLAQVLRARVMEDYGYDFYQFNGISGQSGGLPAAYFVAGSFEDAGYQKPLIPRGMGGYHSLEAYQRFVQWMLVEGRLMQQPNPIHYAPGVTRMEPVVKDPANPPVSEEVDAYFARYQVTNMALSGIPYDVADQAPMWDLIRRKVGGEREGRNYLNYFGSDLGKVLAVINANFGSPNSYVYVSNINTGVTETGQRSHYILVAGKGRALAELAKLIIRQEPENMTISLPSEVSSLVYRWHDNPNIKPPLLDTRVSFAPHDALDLQQSLEMHLAAMGRAGISLSKPQILVLHNWTMADSSQADGDWTSLLAKQQYVEQVNMPGVVSAVLERGTTTVLDMGTGAYLSGVTLRAGIADSSPVSRVGVAARAADGVEGWERLTTRSPRVAYLNREPVEEEETNAALAALQSIKGLTVRVQDQDEGQTIRVRLDRAVEDFNALTQAFFGLDDESPLFRILQAERIAVREAVEPNPTRGLLRNEATLEYEFNLNNGLQGIRIYEDGLLRVMVHYQGDGDVVVSEYHSSRPGVVDANQLDRVYRNRGEQADATVPQFEQIELDTFRRQTRVVYAQDWALEVNQVQQGGRVEDTQEITPTRMVGFATSLQTRQGGDRYTNPRHPNFQAHPHFMIDVMWRAMMTPALADSIVVPAADGGTRTVNLDLDFSRVIDEGKSIRMGVPIRPGDRITTTAHIVGIEDFRTLLGNYQGRRVTVYARAVNQNGEVVAEVLSTLVSRIPTGLNPGQTRVAYRNKELPGSIEFNKGQPTFELPEKKLVAKGSLPISDTVTHTYATDPNRIHVSHLSAALAGIRQGKIMQGLATLALVNEQVVSQMQRDGLIRAYRGIQDLRFSGFVLPGETLSYEVSRVSHSNGDHRFEVVVKNARGSAVMSYNMVAQGPKTVLMFSGQGSQYQGMGDDITSKPEYAEMLDVLQTWIPLDEATSQPIIDLKAEMNRGTQDTSKAQPMIVSYQAILFIDMLLHGLVPDDAAFTGHSLGMWTAVFAATMQKEFRRLTAEGRRFESPVALLRKLEPVLRPIISGVAKRGSVMQKYVNRENPEGMIAVIGDDKTGPLDATKIGILQRLINRAGSEAELPRHIDVANYNTRQVTIMGGHQSALAIATPILTAWGYRVAPLGVKNGFHTALTYQAAADFAAWAAANGNPFMDTTGMNLYMDTMALPLAEIGSGDREALLGVLQDQIKSNVLWVQTTERLLADGYTRFVDVGSNSRSEKGSGRVVGSDRGVLQGFVDAERSYQASHGQRSENDGVEVLYANQILAGSQWGRVTFAEVGGVSEYARPGLVYPKPKAIPAPEVEVQAAVVPTATVAVPAQVIPVSAEQVQAVIDGFFASHPVGEGADNAALAGELAAQLERLGPGAVGVLQARLAALGSGEPQAASGPDVKGIVIGLIAKKADVKPDRVRLDQKITDVITDSLVQIEVMTAIQEALSLSEAQARSLNPTSKIDELIAEISKMVGGGSAGATAVARSPKDVIEKQAMERVLPGLQAQMPQAVAAGPQIVAVAPERVAQVFNEFTAAHQAEVNAGHMDGLVTPLAETYQALGVGAIGPLQARLTALGSGEPQAASGPDVKGIVIGLIAKKADVRPDRVRLDQKITDVITDSLVQIEVMTAIQEALSLSEAQAKSLNPTSKIDELIAEISRMVGGGSTGRASAALSPVDELNKRAIEQVLPRLQTMMPVHGAPMAIADPAQMAELQAIIGELRARVEQLEQGHGVSGVREPDRRLVMGADGQLVDPRDEEISRLRAIIANIEKGTSPNFVYGLMQPNFVNHQGQIYGFARVEQNGGRANLVKFYADLRMGRLPQHERDFNARINVLANQLDEVGQAWLGTLIAKERAAGQTRRVGVLEGLHAKAGEHLRAGTIITGGVVTVSGVNFVPEYGSPQRVNPVQRTDGTDAIVAEMNKVADPKTPEDMQWLLNEGIDLRQTPVLMVQAGTLSAPLLAKMLQMGAPVDVADRDRRDTELGEGRYNNDYYWHLYNDNAARGASLTVIPHFQAGNPHDEEALIKMIDGVMRKVRDGENLDANELNYVRHKLKAYDGTKYPNLLVRLEGDSKRMNGMPEGKRRLTDEEKAFVMNLLLPQIFVNGAAYKDYPIGPEKRGVVDPRTGRVLGDPHSMMAILVLSSRHLALNLAKLHQKYKTGKQVFFLNYYSPNSAIDLGAKAMEMQEAIRRDRLPEVLRILREIDVPAETVDQIERLLLQTGIPEEARIRGLFSVLAGSGTYPVTKAALGPGMTAAEALANGIVDERGNPILIEISAKTGWGKSDGKTQTLMSEMDFFTMMLEELARARGVDLKTLTGDQLGTAHASSLLARVAGRRRETHVPYDHTFGFEAAAKRGVLADILTEAATVEDRKHRDAQAAWQAAHAKAEQDPTRIPNDGSLIDLNDLNIAIRGGSGRYAVRDGDFLVADDRPVVVGYGAVTPMGPTARDFYEAMLGRRDFYNLARSMGVNVSNWDYEQMVRSVGQTEADAARYRGDWARTFREYLKANSGFQRNGEFVDFEVFRDVTFEVDTQIPIANAAMLTKMMGHGYEIYQRPDGSQYALAKAGQKYKLPVTFRLPVTVIGALPGGDAFDFARFGITDQRDQRTGAHGAHIAKMVTGQIMMAMGGYSPDDLHRVYGQENLAVGISTGAGDFVPLNRMTIEPLIEKDVIDYTLMAGNLPDAAAGQVATEMVGARMMAMSLVAACSTGNANIVMATREQFSRYYLATREAKGSEHVDWPTVFSQLWIAGGVDYAVRFNAIFGFDALGALIRDDWRAARGLVLAHGSRPDDEERAGFVPALGGGGVAVEALHSARAKGNPVYGAIYGAEFRTDGPKGAAREAYGEGQPMALFDAWKTARQDLTEAQYTDAQVLAELERLFAQASSQRLTWSANARFGEVGFRRSERTAFLRSINETFSTTFTWDDIQNQNGRDLTRVIVDQTRTLKKKVKFIVIGHKTSTPAGDPFEEASVRSFLESILPPGEFAHLLATKAFIGHSLGGSSGIDAAITPFILKRRILPGNPGLDNIIPEAAQNVTLFHHKGTVDLNEINDPDTIYVVIREAAGFNAKNTAVFEVYGKIPFDTEAQAHDYTKKLIEGYVRERVQRRAERQGLRSIAFHIQRYPHVMVTQYPDLYELYIRSDAVATALLAGQRFDFDNIPSWIYQFPINRNHQFVRPTVAQVEEITDGYERSLKFHYKGDDAEARAEAAAKARVAEAQLTAHNAEKYAEAFDNIADILATFKPGEIAEMGRLAREKGWDKQPMVFYGVSDGMGLRTLLALIASGAVKEVVGLRFDPETNDSGRPSPLGRSFNSAVLEAYARQKGVNLTVFNMSGILYDLNTGAELPLQPEIRTAVEAARSRSETQDINFFDFVAFGAPWRASTQDDKTVASLDEQGQLSLVKVSKPADKDTGIRMTINTMGKNHGRLLNLFNELGWFGENTHTYTADWWGSETNAMLSGVYGGALLGVAKNLAKRELYEFAQSHPEAGFHGYVGYPAFDSMALSKIPGGMLTFVIAKRIYEDVQNGVEVQGVDATMRTWVRHYTMEELAVQGVLQALRGDTVEGVIPRKADPATKRNKIAVDLHEQAIAPEIDRRFNAVQTALEALIAQKRAAFEADPANADVKFKPVLTPEESYVILRDYVTADYLEHLYQYIPDQALKTKLLRQLAQERTGIEGLPLPARLQTEHPFFMRAYSKGMNTPELVSEVIDAGGVGTLAGDNLNPQELNARITAVKNRVGVDAPLVVNLMVNNAQVSLGRGQGTLLDAQLAVVLKNKPVAVSFGNGLAPQAMVQSLHKAGILVIQLAGTVRAAEAVAKLGVDLVIAERNYGPGHINEGEGSDPETLIKGMRQALYDAKIPVIAGGGFVERADVQNAFHWGASAVQLDDPIAYSYESPYIARRITMDPTQAAVVTFVDEEGKTVRVLNTNGARQLIVELERVRREITEERLAKPVVGLLIQRAMEAGARDDVLNGIFFASERFSRITRGEYLASIFRRLNPSTQLTPPEPDPSGGGGGGASRLVAAIHLEDGFSVVNLESGPRVDLGIGLGGGGPLLSAQVAAEGDPVSKRVLPFEPGRVEFDGTAALDLTVRNDDDVVVVGAGLASAQQEASDEFKPWRQRLFQIRGQLAALSGFPSGSTEYKGLLTQLDRLMNDDSYLRTHLSDLQAAGNNPRQILETIARLAQVQLPAPVVHGESEPNPWDRIPAGRGPAGSGTFRPSPTPVPGK